MAMTTAYHDTLAGVRDMCLPAIYDAAARTGVADLQASLHVDYLRDRILLGISQPLFSRRDLETGDYKRLLWPRLQRALGINSDTAKTLRADQRRLMARGLAARAAKPRRMVAAQKRH